MLHVRRCAAPGGGGGGFPPPPPPPDAPAAPPAGVAAATLAAAVRRLHGCRAARWGRRPPAQRGDGGTAAASAAAAVAPVGAPATARRRRGGGARCRRPCLVGARVPATVAPKPLRRPRGGGRGGARETLPLSRRGGWFAGGGWGAPARRRLCHPPHPVCPPNGGGGGGGGPRPWHPPHRRRLAVRPPARVHGRPICHGCGRRCGRAPRRPRAHTDGGRRRGQRRGLRARPPGHPVRGPFGRAAGGERPPRRCLSRPKGRLASRVIPPVLPRVGALVHNVVCACARRCVAAVHGGRGTAAPLRGWGWLPACRRLLGGGGGGVCSWRGTPRFRASRPRYGWRPPPLPSRAAAQPYTTRGAGPLASRLSAEWRPMVVRATPLPSRPLLRRVPRVPPRRSSTPVSLRQAVALEQPSWRVRGSGVGLWNPLQDESWRCSRSPDRRHPPAKHNVPRRSGCVGWSFCQRAPADVREAVRGTVSGRTYAIPAFPTGKLRRLTQRALPVRKPCVCLATGAALLKLRVMRIRERGGRASWTVSLHSCRLLLGGEGPADAM